MSFAEVGKQHDEKHKSGKPRCDRINLIAARLFAFSSGIWRDLGISDDVEARSVYQCLLTNFGRVQRQLTYERRGGIIESIDRLKIEHYLFAVGYAG